MTAADLLLEALPSARPFQGATFVVKFGGEVADDADRLRTFCDEVAVCARHGVRLVLVHGGGKQATELSERLGLRPRVVNGRRVTDEATLDVVKMVFAGRLNTDVLGALRRAGVRGVGLSGVDGGLLTARRRPPQSLVDVATGEPVTVDFGFVGDILGVDPAPLTTLADGGFVPVVAPLAGDDDGAIYNVNADTVAAAVASRLRAAKLVLVTNVDGVLDAEGTVVGRLTCAGARGLIDARVARGGMIPKLQAAVSALEAGVGAVHLVNGTRPGALLDGVFAAGTGTTMLEY